MGRFSTAKPLVNDLATAKEETRQAPDGSNDKKQDGDLAAKKRSCFEYARKIKPAIESDELSREEAEKKLIVAHSRKVQPAIGIK